MKRFLISSIAAMVATGFAQAETTLTLLSTNDIDQV